MLQPNSLSAVWLPVLVFLAGCNSNHVSTVDPLQQYGWQETDAHRELLAEAIDIANNILQEDIEYRLKPGWDFQHHEKNSVRVYWVAHFRIAWSDRIFVLPNEQIIVIHAVSLRHYLKSLADDNSKPYLLAAMLLHELGHVVHDHTGHWESSEEITSDHLNADSTPQKNRELQADRFAARQIRLAMQPGQQVKRFTSAGLAAVALSYASFRVGTQQSLDFFGDTSGERHLDTGYSHPNLALRLLIIHDEIAKDTTTKQLIEDILRAREPKGPSLLYEKSPSTKVP